MLLNENIQSEEKIGIQYFGTNIGMYLELGLAYNFLLENERNSFVEPSQFYFSDKIIDFNEDICKQKSIFFVESKLVVDFSNRIKGNKRRLAVVIVFDEPIKELQIAYEVKKINTLNIKIVGLISLVSHTEFVRRMLITDCLRNIANEKGK